MKKPSECSTRFAKNKQAVLLCNKAIKDFGSIVTTWSMGCLSGLRPPYAPYNSYNHGLANVEIDKLNFNVTNHRIHRGMLLN